MEVSIVMGVPLVIIHFRLGFVHHKSSILDTPMAMETLISSHIIQILQGGSHPVMFVGL